MRSVVSVTNLATPCQEDGNSYTLEKKYCMELTFEETLLGAGSWHKESASGACYLIQTDGLFLKYLAISKDSVSTPQSLLRDVTYPKSKQAFPPVVSHQQSWGFFSLLWNAGIVCAV